MSRIFVKPATPDIKVRKPVNGYLAAEGEEVNTEAYWLRRIADGDVIGTKPAEQIPASVAVKPSKTA